MLSFFEWLTALGHVFYWLAAAAAAYYFYKAIKRRENGITRGLFFWAIGVILMQSWSVVISLRNIYGWYDPLLLKWITRSISIYVTNIGIAFLLYKILTQPLADECDEITQDDDDRPTD